MRGADHSIREVIPCICVCVCIIASDQRNLEGGDLDTSLDVAPKKKLYLTLKAFRDMKIEPKTHFAC